MIKQEQAGHGADGFAGFVAAALKATDQEDLARTGRERLEQALQDTFALITAHEGDGSNIILTPPGEAGDALIIDIISPDMPFIVDSALAAVRAAGGTVRLFSHPVTEASGRRL
ncbi:MAG TPA: hypothetical protein VIL30_12880, partial [Ramlibacter sp.]